jgi:hypothetical protein
MDKMTNNDLQNNTHQANDRVTRTALKTGGELMYSGRVSSSCSTCDIRSKVTPISPNNKIDRRKKHVTKILLKVALNPLPKMDFRRPLSLSFNNALLLRIFTIVVLVVVAVHIADHQGLTFFFSVMKLKDFSM